MAGRGTKFYRKNEADVMHSLGLRPVVNSGAGWIAKEDGENDSVICQLKSTDKSSMSVNKKDIDQLVFNAAISGKVPVFAIQFLSTGEIWIMARPGDLQDLQDLLSVGHVERPSFSFGEGQEKGGCVITRPSDDCIGSYRARLEMEEERRREKKETADRMKEIMKERRYKDWKNKKR